MIAPSKKLIIWFGLTIVPCAILAGLLPHASLPAFGIMGLFAAVICVDALSARKVLSDVDVSLPELVRASAGREIKVPLTISDERERGLHLRLGIDFPQHLTPKHPLLDVDLHKGVKSSLVNWAASSNRTGRHKLDVVYLETLSPMGFWMTRAKRSASSLVCVFPNLLKEKDGLASLFLRTSLGQHTQRQIGKGRDFDQLRDYAPGDPYGDIHWKATAKRGRPVTKVFQIERTQEVYVVVDTSRLSARALSHFLPPDRIEAAKLDENEPDPSESTIMERFVAASLVMGLATQRMGDMFGLITYSDKVDSFVRARSGKVQFDACRDALYTLEPRIVTPDFAELFTFIGSNLRRRALLLFLTNLDDSILSNDFVKQMNVVSQRHLMVVNTPQMPGVHPLFSSSKAETVDDVFKGMAGHMLWERTRQLQKELGAKGVSYYELDNEKMCAQLVTQYLKIKQRQLI
ncbi:protein of unknown function DUF58 [Desulfatibacillum aliphaticivorans]|uniref:DUF58 domain-containing protein n=1 Tax=Desulfatibacillum aliphaticivorans TaxID=218208 RepID=B8FIB0_DESAL|nr:DUF58 domain-containing protein [Desulfatibacillum aliphaticivorans]ACL02677.1 protein of unknown function DUF58 [Desulfatibacillum aliphaticivorans]